VLRSVIGEDFLAVLDKVPDVEPAPEDRIIN
jgi:hypothetical protein